MSADSTSPIQNRIGAVFVHVTDMQRAINWYSTLLGVPQSATSHEGLIYDVPMSGPTGLTLDGHAHTRGTFQPAGPLLMLRAADIHAAHTFAGEHAPDGRGHVHLDRTCTSTAAQRPLPHA